MGDWRAYLIENSGSTYVGVSPTPARRLRQHNGDLAGGAKYTTSRAPGWRHVIQVTGFQTHTQALQFEWAWKHMPPRGAGGVRNRVAKLELLLQKERWTSRSPLASDVPLRVWVVSDIWPLAFDVPGHASVRRVPEGSTFDEAVGENDPERLSHESEAGGVTRDARAATPESSDDGASGTEAM